MNECNANAVYETSEDTVFLLRGAEHLIPVQGLMCEIGCGKGLISAILSEYGEILATDVNLSAARETLARVRRNNATLHVICCDRLEPIREGRVFSLAVFNPPYLPDESFDPRWYGGPTGVEVPLLFIESIFKRLANGGFILFLLSSLSAWKTALKMIGEKGLRVSIIRTFKIGLYEDLLMVLAAKPSV
ncbi:MAG: methyltransferase [Thermofilaceae archaeon]